jgi:hypothetical protein
MRGDCVTAAIQLLPEGAQLGGKPTTPHSGASRIVFHELPPAEPPVNRDVPADAPVKIARPHLLQL